MNYVNNLEEAFEKIPSFAGYSFIDRLSLFRSAYVNNGEPKVAVAFYTLNKGDSSEGFISDLWTGETRASSSILYLDSEPYWFLPEETIRMICQYTGWLTEYREGK